MKIKVRMLVCCLLGWINIASAYDVVGREIYDDYQVRIFNNKIATTVSEISKSSGYYQIDIYAVSVKTDKHPQGLLEVMKSSVPTIDKVLWTITFNQLPVSDTLCDQFELTPCYQSGDLCYKPCFSNLAPEVIAFDNINNKIYLNYPTNDIGTGGGPSLLFEGNINKKEIKFIRRASWDEKGSVSPSGRYLAMYGFSIIDIYDTVNKTWFEANQSENHYDDRDRSIHHNLDIKKWISDTQFIYIDSTHYFISNAEKMSFISAKEITYDIAAKKKLNEKTISKNEFDHFIESITIPIRKRY